MTTEFRNQIKEKHEEAFLRKNSTNRKIKHGIGNTSNPSTKIPSISLRGQQKKPQEDRQTSRGGPAEGSSN
jgi:hypothetical protein